MIRGNAEVKKGVKYLGDSKFELTLTNLTTNDIEELLGTNGTRIAYQFNAAMNYGGEIREEPQNGKLYNVVNGVVQDLRPANRESAADIEEPIGDDDQECQCTTCVHLVDWPNDNDPEKTTKTCEVGVKTDDEGFKCDDYEPIADLGAGEETDDEQEPVNGLQAEEIYMDESAEETEPEPLPMPDEETCETCAWRGDPDCPSPDNDEICDQYKSIEG